MGYGSVTEDSSVSAVDGVQEDHSNLIVPKEYESQSHHGHLPPALPEVVVEALAGPSGMHEVSFTVVYLSCFASLLDFFKYL